MNSCQRDEWTTALDQLQREMDSLTDVLEGLDKAAHDPECASTYMRNLLRRQAEYTNAQILRHRIDVALYTSLLASAPEPAEHG